MASPRSQATIVALSDQLLQGVQGLGGVSIQITGSFVGTISFEGTLDGVNWRALNLTATNATSPVTSGTAPGLWTGACAGLFAVRARASAWTSGTATVTIGASDAAPGSGGGSGGGTGGDGALLDGVDPAIKATVLDLTNSNPLAVSLRDANGDYVAAGAGTQYTEDAAAAADPVGGVNILVRKDALAAITDADSDNVAQRGTNKGEAYVKAADTDVLVGAVNETAPASDTASSGLNGRLQRLAQRITSLIGVAATETSLSAMAGDLGDSADAEASGNGSLIAIAKRIRTLLGGVLNVRGGAANDYLPVRLTDGSAFYSASGGSGGGATATGAPHHFVTAANTNARNVKASAGTLYRMHVLNVADYPIYVKFHDTAGTPTAGAGVVRTVGVQAGREAFVEFGNSAGEAFATGIAVTVVKDIADAGTTAVAASDAVVDIDYA